MTYRPEHRLAFPPPLKQRLPAYAYLALALAASGVVIYAQRLASPYSALFRYVVEGDSTRPIPSSVCALVLALSAIAAVLREHMRGVVLHPDGVELRELLTLGWPKVRRLHWSQIDKVFLPRAEAADQKPIRLDLWDGSKLWLPLVEKASELGIQLERVALARAIPIEGGTGQIDDLESPILPPSEG